jgi:site-specific DNA-methyltransferase (adenine-specific)
MTNKLYYGDNLGVLREHIAAESVDLVYLDPPFNSNATYNVLFKAPDGVQRQAQIEAFDDTWHWTESAENAYWEVLHGLNTDAARMPFVLAEKQSMRLLKVDLFFICSGLCA